MHCILPTFMAVTLSVLKAELLIT